MTHFIGEKKKKNLISIITWPGFKVLISICVILTLDLLVVAQISCNAQRTAAVWVKVTWGGCAGSWSFVVQQFHTKEKETRVLFIRTICSCSQNKLHKLPHIFISSIYNLSNFPSWLNTIRMIWKKYKSLLYWRDSHLISYVHEILGNGTIYPKSLAQIPVLILSSYRIICLESCYAKEQSKSAAGGRTFHFYLLWFRS